MKRFMFLWTVSALFLGMVSQSMASEKVITLIYTGNMWGKVTPCPS
jgi:hypothetical protein